MMGGGGADDGAGASGGMGGGSGGGGPCASVPASSNVTPEITGRMRVAPVRSGGRVASSRDARNAGEGNAGANDATASGSFGRDVNPAGSITRASAVNSAQVVVEFRKSCGTADGAHSSAGASGPQPATLAPRSQ